MASSRGAHRSLYWEGIHHHFGTCPLGLWNDTVWYSSQLLQNRTVNNQICRSANTYQNKLPSSNARSNSQMMSGSLNSSQHRLVCNQPPKYYFLFVVSLLLLYFFGWCCKEITVWQEAWKWFWHDLIGAETLETKITFSYNCIQLHQFWGVTNLRFQSCRVFKNIAPRLGLSSHVLPWFRIRT